MHKWNISMHVLVLALLSSCTSAGKPKPADISEFANADRVHIQGNELAHTDSDTRYVVDPDQIHALYVWCASVPGKWRPIGEAPLLHWIVEFERQGKTLGSCDIGANFLEIYPLVVTLTPQEQQSAVRLLSTVPLR